MATHDYFAKSLENAYALEQDIVATLEKEIDDVSEFPTIKKKYQEHLEVTKRQQETLKDIMGTYNMEPSGVKTGMATMMGKAKEMVSGVTEDKPLKDMIANFAMENAEIASYESLAITAEEIGDTNAAQKLRGILEEEKHMADWLKTQIPELTRHYSHQLAG